MNKKSIANSNWIFNHILEKDLSLIIEVEGFEAYGRLIALANVLRLQKTYFFDYEDIPRLAHLSFQDPNDLKSAILDIVAMDIEFLRRRDDGLFEIPSLAPTSRGDDGSLPVETIDPNDLPKPYPSPNSLVRLSAKEVATLQERLDVNELKYIVNEVEDWLVDSKKGRRRKSHFGTIKTFLRGKKNKGLIFTGAMESGPGYYPAQVVQNNRKILSENQ